MKLENIVPWGRNLAEYKAMFLLHDKDLQKKILGCGDGPSSFNAQLSKQDGNVTSIDPIYQFGKADIETRIDEVSGEIMEQLRKNESKFVWTNIKNPDELHDIRKSAMSLFLEDYDKGKKESRYLFQILPELSFEDDTFDLALSSHFLFLYSEHLDFEFHLKAILEMLRVAKEVRIFPLVTLQSCRSLYIDDIIKSLEKEGYHCKIVKTSYEFQKGGNEMLRIKI